MLKCLYFYTKRLCQWGKTAKLQGHQNLKVNLYIKFNTYFNGLVAYNDNVGKDSSTKSVYIYFNSNSQISVTDDYTSSNSTIHSAPAFWSVIGI